MTSEEIDAIAARVAQLLRADEPPFPRRGLVTTDEVRALLGSSASGSTSTSTTSARSASATRSTDH
jgi:hypothetical protein